MKLLEGGNYSHIVNIMNCQTYLNSVCDEKSNHIAQLCKNMPIYDSNKNITGQIHCNKLCASEFFRCNFFDSLASGIELIHRAVHQFTPAIKCIIEGRLFFSRRLLTPGNAGISCFSWYQRDPLKKGVQALWKTDKNK